MSRLTTTCSPTATTAISSTRRDWDSDSAASRKGSDMRAYGLIVALLAGSLHLDAQQGAKLDTTSFIVVGEGLAAGMADYSLREVYQKNSFPAVMARQMGT